MVHRVIVYSFQNALKPTYEHIQFQKFSPLTPVQSEGDVSGGRGTGGVTGGKRIRKEERERNGLEE